MNFYIEQWSRASMFVRGNRSITCTYLDLNEGEYSSSVFKPMNVEVL